MPLLKHGDLWQAYMEEASGAVLHADLNAAGRALISALNDAEEFAELDDKLVETLHAVAGQLCARGRYSAAAILHARLLEVREKLCDPNCALPSHQWEHLNSLFRSEHKEIFPQPRAGTGLRVKAMIRDGIVWLSKFFAVSTIPPKTRGSSTYE